MSDPTQSSPANPSAAPTHLEPSELGTKEYWDALYDTELANHAADPADTGTNWFDDSDAQDKVVDFLEASLLQLLGPHPDRPAEAPTKTTASFLDLGTGNGALLFGLRDAGWAGPMLGVDYSERSVEFARRIAAGRREAEHEGEGEQEQEEEGEDTEPETRFQLHDILSTPPSALLTGAQAGGWDVVLDKGTFDAVSLSSETDAGGRRVGEGYRSRALGLVRAGGVFVVTSCNWTEQELAAWFAGARAGDEDGLGFEQVGRVQYRSFSFGGVKGQTISTLCFRKARVAG